MMMIDVTLPMSICTTEWFQAKFSIIEIVVFFWKEGELKRNFLWPREGLSLCGAASFNIFRSKSSEASWLLEEPRDKQKIVE